MENKRDPSNSLKRTWVQSKGNNKTAVLGVTVGIPERMNRDRRQHELHSIIYLHICTCMLANLPFFAPVGGVDIGVVDIESVDGAAHIIITLVIITVFASG